VEPILERALKISNSEGMVQIVSFSSEEMEFSKRDNNSSGQGGFEVVKRDVK
jgi:hypothetical protein